LVDINLRHARFAGITTPDDVKGCRVTDVAPRAPPDEETREGDAPVARTVGNAKAVDIPRVRVESARLDL
jgi:hypothetical protein